MSTIKGQNLRKSSVSENDQTLKTSQPQKKFSGRNKSNHFLINTDRIKSKLQKIMKKDYLEKQEKEYRWLLQEKLSPKSKLLLQQAMANVKKDVLGADGTLGFSIAMVQSPRQTKKELAKIENEKNPSLKIYKASQNILGVCRSKRDSLFEINENLVLGSKFHPSPESGKSSRKCSASGSPIKCENLLSPINSGHSSRSIKSTGRLRTGSMYLQNSKPRAS